MNAKKIFLFLTMTLYVSFAVIVTAETNSIDLKGALQQNPKGPSRVPTAPALEATLSESVIHVLF
ncbi:MAG: hypothetical protein BGP01_06850 [Paludibacter sp. 47-17]|jgi:hypothetical protein|nr:MAG: hypothetical protein BGP01_06850 [Paludibacter sp. 47-17]